ncbi:MAG: SPOR domain-containing protein [Bacteroidia bacterium]
MKYIIVFIHALAIAIYQLFFGNPVAVSAKIPDNVAAGKDFVVEVTINKAQVAGFAKLQLEIPPAFVATEVDSKGGSFSASGTVVKIIWTSVPADADLVVKINISVPASATGDKSLQGKFSYIENNAKQQAEFGPVVIKLGGETAVAATDVNAPAAESTSTTTTDAQAFSKPNEPDATITASRKITALSAADNYEVAILLKKGNIKGFAKLTEKIPTGYKVESINNAGATFEFAAGQAKYIWTSIPADDGLTLSYKLVPDGSVQKPSFIEGSEFSYIENDQTKKITLDRQEIIDVNAVSQPIVATETAREPAAAPADVTNTTTQASTEKAAEPIATTQSTQTEKAAEPATTTQASAPKNGNIHYAVQIGAFRNGVNAGSLKAKFNLSENVKTEMNDGFTKCIFGKYNEYKVARDNRETAKNKGAEGAFVTAYNSGARITVQEALMVSNQKWYK